MIYASGSAGGGGVFTIQNLTADGTADGFDREINVDASTNNVKVTLPSTNSTSNKGHQLIICRSDNTNNVVSIVPSTTSEKIGGVVNGTIYLYGKDDSIVLTSQGDGNAKITSDNRSSTGSSLSYMKARASIQQTVANTAPIIFDVIEKQYGSGISINTTNGQITLKAGKTYKLEASGAYCSVGFWNTSWYENGVEMLGSRQQAEGAAAGSDLTNIIVVSPTVDTIYTYGNSSGGSCVIGNTTAKLFPWVYVEEVSRQATVIRSVDTLYAKPTNVIAVGDIPITVLSGNLTYSSPYVTLYAGKTYELMANLSFRTATYACFGWYDSTDTLLPLSTIAQTGALSANDPLCPTSAYATITPTSNIQVKLRISSINGATMLDTTASFIYIKQVGSTATSSVPSSLLDTSNGLNVSGFTKLGSDAPAVKTKLYTGTMPTVGNSINVAHGLDYTKIISFSCMVLGQGNVLRLPIAISGSDIEYSARINQDTIWLTTGSNATLIAGYTYKFLITYTA
jgi:hypothetical protein